MADFGAAYARNSKIFHRARAVQELLVHWFFF
jgi:hypothetical protein